MRLRLAVFLCAWMSAPAWAQIVQSDLPPIQSLNEPYASESGSDWSDADDDAAPRASAAIAPIPAPVREANMPTIRFDALGSYPADKKEKSWSLGQIRGLLDRLPPQLPASIRAPLTQALAQEWTIASGEPNSNGSLLAQRAEMLARWGSVEAAQRLLALVPAAQGGEVLAWTNVQITWLAGAKHEACAAIEANQTKFPDSLRWRMPGILCRALDGRGAEAQLALDLMDEQGQTPDPLIRHAVEALRLKKPLADVDVPVSLWNQIVLTEAGGSKALEAQLVQLPVPLLRRIGSETRFDAALRKHAATRLVQVDAGVSPGEWLTPVRMEIPPDAPEWQKHEARRTYAMLQALGETVNPTLANTLGVQATVASDNHELNAFESALANRQARLSMLQLAALLSPDLSGMEDGMLARIVQALQGAGQRPLARQIAAEAIASIGAVGRTEKTVSPAAVASPKAGKPVAKPAATEKPMPRAAPKAASPKAPKPDSSGTDSPRPKSDVLKSDAPKSDVLKSDGPKINLP